MRAAPRRSPVAETGEVDVIVENWGHDDLKQKYIEEKDDLKQRYIEEK